MCVSIIIDYIMLAIQMHMVNLYNINLWVYLYIFDAYSQYWFDTNHLFGIHCIISPSLYVIHSNLISQICSGNLSDIFRKLMSKRGGKISCDISAVCVYLFYLHHSVSSIQRKSLINRILFALCSAIFNFFCLLRFVFISCLEM